VAGSDTWSASRLALYDGARTGRYRGEQLSKEEKTLLGARFAMDGCGGHRPGAG
jgi:hypothetical protein